MQTASYLVNLFLLLSAVYILYCNMSNTKLVSVDFEVFGKVQGVFFRKYTANQAKSLKVNGWCMNTPQGTVQGCLQGEEKAIVQMKMWLRSVGSPSSQIEKCEFKNKKEIQEFTYNDFNIRR